MGRLIFILGGVRSGKSAFAQKLAVERGGRVTFLATAQALDEEMQRRISLHQQNRPAGWQTLEIESGVEERLCADPIQADVVILDCLTLLVSNLVLSTSPDEDQPDESGAARAVQIELDGLLEVIHASPALWIVVSNEVGMGLVPPYPLGRLYRDLLGKANMQLAGAADEAYLLVAGLPIPLHLLKASRGK